MNKRSARSAVNQLRKAKDLLINVGWVKGMSRRYDYNTNKITGYCATGALGEVQGRAYAAHDIAIGALNDVAAKRARKAKYEGSIVRYNDSRGRTKEQVLAAFDDAIALVEKEANLA